jgi:DNA-binding transcriptional MerR regulator
MHAITAQLPAIPAKRYFTIGEVSELCGVKSYVLRYWEQEFTQLRPMKRRGNRRYYQHHEVLLIRRIRELLYDQGFTISGARNQLQETDEVVLQPATGLTVEEVCDEEAIEMSMVHWPEETPASVEQAAEELSDQLHALQPDRPFNPNAAQLRIELMEILEILAI